MKHASDCSLCYGKGYISDGNIEDGMMTGRQECPGYGWIRFNAKFTYDFGRRNQDSLLSYGREEEWFDTHTKE